MGGYEIKRENVGEMLDAALALGTHSLMAPTTLVVAPSRPRTLASINVGKPSLSILLGLGSVPGEVERGPEVPQLEPTPLCRVTSPQRSPGSENGGPPSTTPRISLTLGCPSHGHGHQEAARPSTPLSSSSWSSCGERRAPLVGAGGRGRATSAGASKVFDTC